MISFNKNWTKKHKKDTFFSYTPLSKNGFGVKSMMLALKVYIYILRIIRKGLEELLWKGLLEEFIPQPCWEVR